VLRIPLRGGPYGIKPLDLLLFTAIGEHWRRRRADRRMARGRGCHGLRSPRRACPRLPVCLPGSSLCPPSPGLAAIVPAVL